MFHKLAEQRSVAAEHASMACSHGRLQRHGKRSTRAWHEGRHERDTDTGMEHRNAGLSERDSDTLAETRGGGPASMRSRRGVLDTL